MCTVGSTRGPGLGNTVESFIRAQMWLRELVPVGSKGDLSELRQVTLQEGHSLAIDRGLHFMETSAKSGNQVSDLMLAIANRVKRCMSEHQSSLTEWQETELVNLRRSETLKHPLASCCPSIGP
ncbi:ras-related protein Rab-17-like [Coregonus clupeaformis]|uniref:ras-related protein Rab-17-like n=1 Tax=Coregonus clupeaformis TaxID=59861 RepID=UPI001BDF9610|nr:ras-related protein Rab-17-like [Coregonus clupeaformis]